MVAIRGAITVEKNDREHILCQSEKLFKTIVEKNNLKEQSIVSITFSTTKDLTKVYPAVAIRQLGYVNTPLFCVQEMNVENSMEKVIRALILVDDDSINKLNVKHIYLEKAKALRPDIRG